MEIAIVGLGCVLPAASNVQQFRDNLVHQHCAIRGVPKDRWDVELYYDPARPSVEDTCYCRLGAFVEGFDTLWTPLEWRLPIPPNIDSSIDVQHKYAICATRQALIDCDYFNKCRDQVHSTSVIMGVMSGSGNQAYRTTARIYLKQVRQALAHSSSFGSLPESARHTILADLDSSLSKSFPMCTSNAHAGEFGNCAAGRISNLFDFKGPSFSTDAACASSFAALRVACDLLLSGRCYAAVTGGSEAQMDIHHYIKYAKLGALSPDGSFPFDERANGFVMGEGAVSLVLKLLHNARKDHDKIYAVIRGVGASSDGRGKSMTAPTVPGQVASMKDAWREANLIPSPGLYIEAHGTGTKLGDPIEVESIRAFLNEFGLPNGSVSIGSVKANVGHLRAAAGAVGLLKATLMLSHQTHVAMPLFQRAAPRLALEASPLYVLDSTGPANLSQACINSFGFGGTNWHVVMTSNL